MANATREQKKRTHTRRILIRAGAAGAVAVVVLGVLSIVNVFGSQGPSIVDKATAALAYAENAVLHMHMVGTQTNPDGTVATWEDESWQSNVRSIPAPPDRDHRRGGADRDIHQRCRCPGPLPLWDHLSGPGTGVA